MQLAMRLMPHMRNFSNTVQLLDGPSLTLKFLSLSAERALEDNEVIRDVMRLWPSKNQPILKLKPFASKNDLWNKRSPVSSKLC